MNRYRLFTSQEYNHLNIKFVKKSACLDQIMSSLQRQAFRINSSMFEFLKSNKKSLENEGLLMASFLANVNPSIVYEKLRIELSSTKRNIAFSSLVAILDKQIKKASSLIPSNIFSFKRHTAFLQFLLVASIEHH